MLVTSCSQQRDRNGILTEKAMVDVLYDYQLAISLSNENHNDSTHAATEYRYVQAVFAKHGIDEDVFNLSVAHYARNPKQLLEITQKVSERLMAEVENDHQKRDETISKAQDAQKSDTTIVWTNRPGAVLSANGDNILNINLSGKQIPKADQYMIGFKSSWVYREGGKMVALVVTSTYDNDSVSVRTESIREYDHSQGVSVYVPEKRRLKQINISFYQSASWQKYPQILSLSDIVVWGITNKKEKK